MRAIVTAFLLASILVGCQTPTLDLGAGLLTTTEAVALEPGEAATIAADLARMLEQRFPPGQTTFALASPANAVFGPLLEANLRDLGYGVSSDPAPASSGAIAMAYLVDRIEQGYLVRIQAGKTYELSRLYHSTGGSFQAASGFSLRDEEISP